MIYAAILLAGTSSRMNSEIPKQFIEINDKKLFEYPLETFDRNKEIDRIVLVCKKDNIPFVKNVLNKNKYHHEIEIIEGGNTRQESTFNVLKYLKNKETNDEDSILIHDACRVLLTENLLDTIIQTIKENEAVVPVLKMTDSICFSKNKDYIEENLDRNNYFSLQTPQAFKLNFIFKAHKNAKNNNLNTFTDDTSLAIMEGGKVKLIEGEKFNFKVTTFEDLFLLKKLIGG